MLDLSDEPDFVNAEGTKWWKDKHLTNRAIKPDAFGTTLGMMVYAVETSVGFRTYALIDDKDIVYTNQSAEAIACHIDILKLLKRDPTVH